MKQHALHLHLPGPGCGPGTKLEINGHNLSKCATGITVQASVKQVTTATVELVTYPVDIDAEQVVVHLDDDATAALISMGWTPPDGQKTAEFDQAPKASRWRTHPLTGVGHLVKVGETAARCGTSQTATSYRWRGYVNGNAQCVECKSIAALDAAKGPADV